ncbi:gluconokinase [Ammoniphilus resinae]|uniref:Gluconokinase n=1 Tax=Ammoniphilus resinae TaxID=861532 RepID=A0ABS4GJZ3_9BACL|nr:gluconokinase [Ammoniphilus resinae]MBP1930584.1 gluconokinase [Ammoniphilus resinae]
MYVIGLDFGTTSTKAIVFDKRGNAVSEHGVEYPILTPNPGWAELDPEIIYVAAITSLRVALSRVKSSEVVAIGLSTAMHSLILMDELNQPLTRVITWADNRSDEQAHVLKQSTLGKQIYLRTGTPIHPMSPLCKIMWFKENEPELFKQTHKFISIKEYLLFRWFGQFITDFSVASATGLLNLQSLEYDSDALQTAGIKKEQLSTLVPTTYVLQGLSDEVAEAVHIRREIPVVIGASDGCLANLGIGAMNRGEVGITIGTSGAIRTVTPKPITDPSERTFCYALAENHWVVGGATNNGGLLLRWFKEQFARELSYEKLTEEAGKVGVGSEGLFCLPYLSGERAPIWNAHARGCYVGMALHHKREHFARSAMEGVIYAIFGVGKALQQLAGDFGSLRASGGFVQSKLGCQILADVFGTEVIVPENPQSSGWGAAILALFAIGEIPRIDYYCGEDSHTHTYAPHSDNHIKYQQFYTVYEEIYNQLSNTFEKIAEIQGIKKE